MRTMNIDNINAMHVTSQKNGRFANNLPMEAMWCVSSVRPVRQEVAHQAPSLMAI